MSCPEICVKHNTSAFRSRRRLTGRHRSVKSSSTSTFFDAGWSCTKASQRLPWATRRPTARHACSRAPRSIVPERCATVAYGRSNRWSRTLRSGNHPVHSASVAPPPEGAVRQAVPGKSVDGTANHGWPIPRPDAARATPWKARQPRRLSTLNLRCRIACDGPRRRGSASRQSASAISASRRSRSWVRQRRSSR